MDREEPESPELEDPEIAALLDFEPVVRKNKRRDGWSDGAQRAFIVGLAETGSIVEAAARVGRTLSGAYTVRGSAGARGFAAAWDGAMALHRERLGPPPRSSAAPVQRPGRRGPNRREREELTPEERARERQELIRKLLELYRIKLGQERRARLQGRIPAADLYFRQLTMIELGVDLAGGGGLLLRELERGGTELVNIVATPSTLVFDEIRREIWREAGEPERPELPPLGRHRNGVATGVSSFHDGERDGPEKEWRARTAEQQAHAAQAQLLWEEKAAREAAEWRARLERDDPGALAEALRPPERIYGEEDEARGLKERMTNEP
jgi:hypothetical protein